MYEPGDASNKACRYLKQLGFDLAAEPESAIPVLPSDITEISDQELMSYFQQVNAWLDYVEVYYVAAQVDEKQEEQIRDSISATEQIKHKAAKTVSAMKAHIFENPEYVKQEEKLLTIYARRRMMETVYNALQRKQFLLSRELSRRQIRNGQ